MPHQATGLKFRDVTVDDAPAIAALQNAAAGALTARFGEKYWSALVTERSAILAQRHVAAAWPADAIRLDAYDAEAGAGAFYEKCGYRQRGRVVYRGDPLVYYELLLR